MDDTDLESRIAQRRESISALERIVYARPAAGTTHDDIARAERELVQLQAEQARDAKRLHVMTLVSASRSLRENAQATLTAPRTIDEHPFGEATPEVDSSRARRVKRFVLAASAAVSLLLVTVLALQFGESSLRVFDRAQTEREAEFGASWPPGFSSDPTSWRLLESQERWDVYAFLGGEGDVCLYVDYRGSGGSHCIARETFTENGMSYPAITPFYDDASNEWKRVTFSWGPNDGLHTALDLADSSDR
jgi:hypothetical protein